MSQSRKQRTEQVSPTALEDGDIICYMGMSLRVVGEPQTMHSGLGPFDSFKLMIRTELEGAEGGARSVEIWPLHTVLTRLVGEPEESSG